MVSLLHTNYLIDNDFEIGKHTIKDLLCKIPVKKWILMNLIEDYWFDCAQKIDFLPLRFNYEEDEEKYKTIIKNDIKHRLKITSIAIMVASLLNLIATLLVFTQDWIKININPVKTPFIVINITAFISATLIFASLLVPFLNKNVEFNLYICVFLNVMPYIIYCIWANNKIGTSLNWTYVMSLPDRTIMLITLRYYCEFYMYIQCIELAVLVVFLSILDIFIKTRSKFTLILHAIILIVVLVRRVFEIDAVPDSIKSTSIFINILTCVILFVAWFSRWFKECYERCFIIKLESKAKHLEETQQKLANRDRSISPVEEILKYLDSVIDALTVTANSIAKTTTKEQIYKIIRQLQDINTRIIKGSELHQMRKRNNNEHDIYKFIEDAYNEQSNNDSDKVGEIKTQGSSLRSTIVKQKVSFNVQKDIVIGDIKLSSPVLNESLLQYIGRDLNVMICEFTNNNQDVYLEVAYILLKPYLIDLNCDDKKLIAFCWLMKKMHFENNLFHNTRQSSQIAHFSAALIHSIGMNPYVDWKYIFSLYIVVLISNIGHSGRQSQFYKKTNSFLSIVSNDISIYEYCKYFVLYNLLNTSEDANILQDIDDKAHSEIRKTICDLLQNIPSNKILELLSKSRINRTHNKNSHFTDVHDQLLLLSIIYKASEFSYCTFEWTYHLNWSLRLQEELYQQGDEETKYGFVPTFANDRKNHSTYSTRIVNQFDKIILPVFEELFTYTHESRQIKNLQEKLQKNHLNWNSMMSNNTRIELPSQLSGKSADSRFSEYVIFSSLQSDTIASFFESIEYNKYNLLY